LILAQQATTASLNRHHPLARKALLVRERVLTTTSILQEQHGWVAFTVLEQALRTCRICAGNPRARQLWLELFVKLDVLHTSLQSQPDGIFQTTALTLNLDSPVTAIPRQQVQRNQLYLILACSNYSERTQLPYMAASYILRAMTGLVTHVEARAALKQGEQEGIIESEIVEGGRKGKARAIRLRQESERVRECLVLRDHLIRLIERSLQRRPSGIGAAVLVDAFWNAYQLPEDEGWFWLRILEQDGIVLLSSLKVGSGQRKEKIVDLRLGDPIVKLARQHVRR
jgi:hypothetical protein